MRTVFFRFRHHQSGATSGEYAVGLALLGLAIWLTVSVLGVRIGSGYSSIATEIARRTPEVSSTGGASAGGSSGGSSFTASSPHTAGR